MLENNGQLKHIWYFDLQINACMESTQLKRTISFPLLLMYGVGTLVGAGFYALSGKIAGMAGFAAPLAFLLAGIIAFFNVFTFAELSSRFPYSAGEARYVQEAFNKPRISQIVGLLVILTGVVSAATLSVATINFLQDLVSINMTIGIIVLVIIMGLITAWGVGESVMLVTIITVLEVGALIYILFSKGGNMADLPELIQAHSNSSIGGFTIVGLLSGAFLSFYAFVGFEDMVNMAEEVVEPRKTLPKALIWAVLSTTILYVLVTTTMISTVPIEELATANNPLERIIRTDGIVVSKIFIIVSIFTGLNAALVQMIMASRVIYGLSRQNQLPEFLGHVHPKTQTPIKATIIASVIILVLATIFPLVGLASTTSFIILMVFAILNMALIRIKNREEFTPDDIRTYPVILPWISLMLCFAILTFKIVEVLG